MARRFKIGDHVSWNSEAGQVSATIIATHTADFYYRGHVHHASGVDPQYEDMLPVLRADIRTVLFPG